MIVWEAELDGKYQCRVERTKDYKGRLTVSCGELEILNEEVGLSYGAIFGPDVADVALWEDMCVAAVDKLKVDKHA